MSEFVRYHNLFICRTEYGWRVRTHPLLSYAIHHGTFDTMQQAKNYIDDRARSETPFSELGKFSRE